MLSRRLVMKFSTSELSRKFIKSALLVGSSFPILCKRRISLFVVVVQQRVSFPLFLCVCPRKRRAETDKRGESRSYHARTDVLPFAKKREDPTGQIGRYADTVLTVTDGIPTRLLNLQA